VDNEEVVESSFKPLHPIRITIKAIIDPQICYGLLHARPEVILRNTGIKIQILWTKLFDQKKSQNFSKMLGFVPYFTT
jgi:hypothetical protein